MTPYVEAQRDDLSSNWRDIYLGKPLPRKGLNSRPSDGPCCVIMRLTRYLVRYRGTKNIGSGGWWKNVNSGLNLQ